MPNTNGEVPNTGHNLVGILVRILTAQFPPREAYWLGYFPTWYGHWLALHISSGVILGRDIGWAIFLLENPPISKVRESMGYPLMASPTML